MDGAGISIRKQDYMFQRISIIADGQSVVSGSPSGVSRVSPSHLSWMEQLLVESPASLQDVALANLADGQLTLEWQSVFQGVGVTYFRTSRGIIAFCLLLEGRFPTSERAAIDAVEQAVHPVHNRRAGFNFVRKHKGRPLRAMIMVEKPADPEESALMEYWGDCLALAYFNRLQASNPTSHRDIAGQPDRSALAG